MRSLRRSAAIAFALTLGLQAADAQAPIDVLDRALRDELKRSMEQLRLMQLDKPYFISYHVVEMHSVTAFARYGSLVSSDEGRGRTLSVELRIGDYSFDNSGFFVMPSMSSRGAFGGSELPLDDDYAAFRRQIWLATDAAYKHAVEAIAAKRSARLNRRTTDSIPDFSKEPPTQTVDEDALPPVTLEDVRSLARDLSGLKEATRLQASSASVTVTETRERLVTSEGTTYSRTRPLLMVNLDGSTQANDGSDLHATSVFLGSTLDAASTRTQLEQRMRTLALGLDSLRAASTIERYSGPVLFEGTAAAQLFADVFAPALIGHHPMQSAIPRFSEMMSGALGRGGSASFADKLGGRVLPEWMSVTDDPTLTAFEKQPVLGHYKVDEEGVVAHAKTVVAAGYLKTLLTTRAPVEGVASSTGNARGMGAAPSTLVVAVDSGVSEAALRARLLTAVQRRKLPYGIIVRELQAGGTAVMMQSMFEGDVGDMMERVSGRERGSNAVVIAAYRVYPDGHEERIRGTRLSNFTIESFRDVDAASSSRTVWHEEGGVGFSQIAAIAGGDFGGGAPPISTYVVPSLLFDDVSLSKPAGERTTSPLSAPPPGS
jgi:hypothetical protein